MAASDNGSDGMDRNKENTGVSLNTKAIMKMMTTLKMTMKILKTKMCEHGISIEVASGKTTFGTRLQRHRQRESSGRHGEKDDAAIHTTRYETIAKTHK